MHRYYLFYIFHFALLLASCTSQHQISKFAASALQNSSLKNAHVGISIFEPASNKYWFNYQADHYFVPASNTKIPTCYAAMKYLGDSLVGLRYAQDGDTLILVKPTGDPTFLHPDFQNQPVLTFLKTNRKSIMMDFSGWQDEALGSGWAWDDYNEPYMAERSAMPAYGNLVTVADTGSHVSFFPDLGKMVIDDSSGSGRKFLSKVVRERASNVYHLAFNGSVSKSFVVPFSTEDPQTTLNLISEISNSRIYFSGRARRLPSFTKIHSQATDSVLKPMMHRSDNFFAEQSLLMVGSELLGVMNDEKIIDTLLKTDFKDLPQKPRWVDGSGLSRYNLFSPQDFVFILNKMKNDFGISRTQNILPTGNEGTLTGYYVPENGYIFAKTGTLSGVVSLSGFLYTKKSKLLIFSVLINNHNGSATEIRRSVERFIESIRNKF